MPRAPLPIDSALPEIEQILNQGSRLLVRAEPGAGKTTRVPPLLAGRASIVPPEQLVVVLEPRRIAARLAARRVAMEQGCEVGQEVGYQVRFERRRSRDTRLLFVTEGVLLRWLLDDPELPFVGAVVLDEFHERSLEADLCLALLREVQLTIRPELRIVVMSATLDTGPLSSYLDPVPMVEVPGRQHPIEIDYMEDPKPPPMEESVRLATEHLLDDGFRGSILVFVPGAAEIRRCLRALEPVARKAGFDLHPLHGDLTPEEQERAIRPSSRPRVIVSTNVAEASVTVDGVHAVIDSGRVRVARFDVWSGIDRLVTERVSRASAIQRAGRAGRLGPGRCIRLYREREFESFAPSIEPEIERVDLSGAVLAVKAWGDRRLDSFAWLTPPRPEALQRARTLLSRLGALEEENERVTDLGRRLLRYPVAPRLARVLDAGREMGVPREAALAVAIAESGDLRRAAGAFADRTRAVESADSDLLLLSDLFREAEREHFSRDALDRLGLESRATWRAARIADQLCRRNAPEDRRFATRPIEASGIVTRSAEASHSDTRSAEVAHSGERSAEASHSDTRSAEVSHSDTRSAEVAHSDTRSAEVAHSGERWTETRGTTPPSFTPSGSGVHPSTADVDERVRRAVLCGYPDRVARRQGPGTNHAMLVGGTGIELDRSSAVRTHPYFVALEAIELPARQGEGRTVRVRLASAIEPQWLEEHFPGSVRTRDEVVFDPRGQRVVARRVTAYHDLVLREQETGDADPEAIAAALREAVLAAPDRMLEITREAQDWIDRVRTLARFAPELAVPDPMTELLPDALTNLCFGVRSASELRRAPLLPALRAALSREHARALEEWTPATVELPSRRSARVDYSGDLPVLAARLQEFFGASNTPKLGSGRVPLLLHLLAPSHRPLQVTQDLASFWRTVYPKVRGELRRRYPKHSWPEDPLRAPAESRPGRPS